MRTLGLKIDVDTYWGMKNGVPRLLTTLKEFGVKGTFFLSIGPDNSGRAIIQLIKNPLFLKKMLRTKAASLYGWKTSLYGTLLPAPMIALSFPEIVRQILEEGHEVQFHAWDHRRWQDELFRKSVPWIEQWFEKGIDGFKKLTGYRPTAFGAPSWLIDDRVLRIVKQYEFEYLSCTRASEPFIHEEAGIIEIPSNLPCFEELDPQKGLPLLKGMVQQDGINILPVHAEVEGGMFEPQFRELLQTALSAGCRIQTMHEIKILHENNDIKTRHHQLELLSGRHSPCAV